MRFVATHEDLNGLGPDREQGEQLCRKLRWHLDHVYLFNTPATTELDSLCPICGATIIHRVFFGPMAARVLSCQPDGVCSCGYRFPCKGQIEPIPEVNPRILGGYRSILGVQYLAGVLTVLGVTDEQEVDRISTIVIANGYLQSLMQKEDSVETFIEMLHDLATLTGREEVAGRITALVQSIVSEVADRVADAGTPRVLAVFCHPLSPVYAPKFINTLVLMAGGTSLNREQNFQESTNAEYTVEAFNQLDPDVILVTGFFLPNPDEFIATCRNLGIACSAIREHRVFMQDSKNTPGALGWLITLMDVANQLHPEVCHYSLTDERERMDALVNKPPEKITP
jgi:hypothetical protein